jgi:hypothetical protein
MDVRVDLDVIGALEGSDKSSSYRYGWDYLRHYEALLADYRHLPINVLEIGIGKGPSLRMWRWFFTQAEITGIDTNPECLQHAGPRVTVEIGSQIDTAFLDQVCERAPPMIILDDGSHQHEHMITTFEYLLPLLEPGGIYIVEDVLFRQGAAPNRSHAPDYFLEVARRCFAAEKVPARLNVPDYIVALVDRVTFLGHAVAVHKRGVALDTMRGVATADAYLPGMAASNEPHENLAEWIERHEGPVARAEEAIRVAIAHGGRSARLQLIQASNLLRAGEKAKAGAIVRKVATNPPASPHLLLVLATLQRGLGDVAGVLRTVDEARTQPKIGPALRHRFDALLQEDEG